MLFLGHIAASLLIADATRSDRAAAVSGNLLPDVFDKTGSWIFRLMPARWLAHGLPFYLAVVLSSRGLVSGAAWRGFALGYAGHLVCDLWAGGRVPWFAPFEPQRKRRKGFRSWGQFGLFLVPEFIGAAIIAWLANRPAKQLREWDEPSAPK
jgi:hypothetical protein